MTNVEGRKPEGAPERSPKAGEGAPSGVDGNVAKRFSVQRKMAVVARMLRGEPLELVALETNVSKPGRSTVDLATTHIESSAAGAPWRRLARD